MTTPSALKPAYADYSHIEPLPDPPREPDMQQRMTLSSFDSTLRAYFAYRDDVLVCGEGYLQNGGTFDGGAPAPDCVFADGVDPKAIISRNGYVISEVGKPPDFVLEVASRSTGRRDYAVKPEIYAAYGVGEYWRFDHTGGRFHDAPLAGDKLVDGKYVPIAIVREPDGRLWGYSEALGLELWWDDGRLRFRDPNTGIFLPTVEELQFVLEATTSFAERERVGRQTAEARAEAERAARESERAARQAAEARVAELEAELRNLRDE